MTEQTSPAEGTGATERTTTSRWSVLVPAAALVVGLVIGGVVVGVAGGDDDGAVSTSPSAAPSASGDATSEPSGGSTLVVVPDECLAAASTVGEVTDVLRRGVGALSEFRADELRSLLRELETLDQQAREQADACRDVRTEASAPAP